MCCILRLHKCNPLDEKDNLGEFVCECWDKQVESSEGVSSRLFILSDSQRETSERLLGHRVSSEVSAACEHACTVGGNV